LSSIEKELQQVKKDNAALAGLSMLEGRRKPEGRRRPERRRRMKLRGRRWGWHRHPMRVKAPRMFELGGSSLPRVV
jgi:hypothetical protein